MIYLLPFLSVVLGFILAVSLPPKNKRNLKLLMAFSGSFLLTLTVTHLLPEVYVFEMEKTADAAGLVHHEHAHDNHELHNHHHDHDHHHNQEHSHTAHDHQAMKTVGLFIMIGIVFQIILEFFSKGAEHGHVHTHERMTQIPWLLFLSLCLHALLEGMPLSHHTQLAWGIAIHHFPIAIILTVFFQQSGLSKKNIFLFMILFSLMTPAGTWVSESLPFLSEYYTQISAVVVGILFHISSTIIFESSEGHKFNLAKLSSIVAGIVLGYLM